MGVDRKGGTILLTFFKILKMIDIKNCCLLTFFKILEMIDINNCRLLTFFKILKMIDYNKLLSAHFFQYSSENSFRNTIRVSNGLGPDQDILTYKKKLWSVQFFQN